MAPICTTRRARLPVRRGSTSTMLMNRDCPSGLLLPLPPEKENQRNDQGRREPLPVRTEKLGEGAPDVRAHVDRPPLRNPFDLITDLDVDVGDELAVAALARR